MSVIFEPHHDDDELEVTQSDDQPEEGHDHIAFAFVPEKLIRRMRAFARDLNSEDLVLLNPYVEKVEYKYVHKDMKKKGGTPPRDYTAVESLIDLRSHLSRGEYQKALPVYYYLRRITEG